MRFLLRILLLSLFIGLQTISYGQLLPLHFYTTKDGLPSNWITAMTQDSRGYLWIGTSEGLSVYDGVAFRNYTTADGLSNNFITVLKESARHPGTMWIGTMHRGLTKFVDGRFERIPFEAPANAVTVNSIEEDANGVVLCGTNRGVFHIDGDTARTLATTIPFGRNHGLVAASDHLIWFAGGSSVAVRSDTGGPITLLSLPIRTTERVEWMRCDADGDMWLGFTSGLVMAFRDTTLLFTRNFHTILWGFLLDSDGLAWFVTEKEILKVRKRDFPDGAIIHMGIEHGFPEPAMPFEDQEGNLWFMSYANGLIKLSNRALRRFPTEESVRWPILDSNEHVWMPTGGGFSEVWKGTGERWGSVYHRAPDVSKMEPGGPIDIDSQNRLWAASTDGHLRCYDLIHDSRGSTQIRLVKKLALPSGHPLRMLIDRDNRMWYSIGDQTVVLNLNASSPTIDTLQFSRGLSIRRIYQDRNGDVWLGEFYQGLFLFRRGNYSGVPDGHFTIENGLPDNGIRSFAEDESGRLWVGTRYGGVAIYDGQGFRTISIEDGLISNSIWDITRDSKGRMWLATGSGLISVDARTGREFPRTAELLGESVGFCVATRSDLIWFGVSSTHLSVFDAAVRGVNSVPPPVYITRVMFDDSTMPPEESAELPFDRNNCLIEFVGISFRDEHDVQYQYRMGSFSWSKLTKQRNVSYANLRPGEYVFEVQAINSDGILSARPATFSFSIVPPFWQRWWFIGLCVAAVLTGLFALYRARLNQLLAIERLRLRIAGDLHDDVGTDLSSIVVASQIMERQSDLSDEDRTQLGEIRAIASGAQETMRDIVWMLNPGNDSLDDVVLKMRDAAGRLLQNIRYRFIAPQEKLLGKVSIEFKRNLLLIFKEILNNIVRHSSASEVVIEVRQDEGTLALHIRDNGKGFDVDRKVSGSGLEGLRRRTTQMGGTIDLLSRAGEGTTVTVSVKYHANA